jgi:hypothetical protein
VDLDIMNMWYTIPDNIDLDIYCNYLQKDL